MKSFIIATLLTISMATSTLAEPIGDSPSVTLKPIDYADGITTAIGVANGFEEGNPIIAWAGKAAPVVALAMKYVAKRVLVASGVPVEDADHAIGIGSAFGVGNNVLILAGASGPVGLAAGVLVALAYNDMRYKDKSPKVLEWTAQEGR